MRRIRPQKFAGSDYRQIWRIVDGAVAQAFNDHPEYLAPGARVRTVRNSIVKRVAGAVTGHAAQSARVRSEASNPADATGEGHC
jgi:hypothetical protein